MKTLGQIICELREEQGLSLQKLGKQLGVSAAFLSDIEKGHRYPSEKVLKGIAQVLGSTFADLRQYDPRLPLDDLKRLAESNPLYAVALRKVIEKNVSPQDLMEFAEKYQGKT
jgi:transcriptional regulator with XRE-family HTH domain